MIVGMDFGTTNSGMAVYNGRVVNVLPLDPSNRNPKVVRTALYITNDQTVYIGRAAVDHYFDQNIGRAVKMQKVWLGELEIYGADMYYVTDAYAWVDVYSPGRLFLSIKTGLRNTDYTGTVVGQFYYALENLIALYMTVTKTRAEQVLGQELKQVVLGRPVRFSLDPAQDELAQARLLQAAFRAGYEKVYLQPEPIAVAFNYETTIDTEQNVLVFDFGGGTLDITVMRLGDPQRRQVLATGGIPIAGDVFDQKLVQAKLTPHFGKGSQYGPRHKSLTMPQWIYDYFSDWQMILELQSADNKRILREIAQTARRRHQIEALESLVASNYGLKMFDVVEQAKRRISDTRGAEILLEGPNFKVREFVTRSEFEHIIRAEILAIRQHVDETVAASGLKPEEIDVVIRTGGSAQIPAFYDILCQKFGQEKVRSLDTFSSVTAGLGVIGRAVAQGELDLKAYTPEGLAYATPELPHSRPHVTEVNLNMLQRRILVAEGASKAGVTTADQVLIVVDEGGRVTAVPLTAAHLQQEEPIPLPAPAISALAVPLAAQLLLITSTYRFLLITPRQLLELQDMDLAVTDLYQFTKHERVVIAGHWTALKEQKKLLIVTSTGYARPYPMDVLQTSVEAPIPLKFDQPLPGIPVVVIGMDDEEDELILVTQKGRAARFATRRLRVSGVQLLNVGSALDDRVNGAVLAQPHDELVLITADGYGKRFRAEWIEAPPKINAKGRTIVSRRSHVVGVSSEIRWAATSRWLMPLTNGRLPLEESTKTYPWLSLSSDEAVTTIL